MFLINFFAISIIALASVIPSVAYAKTLECDLPEMRYPDGVFPYNHFVFDISEKEGWKISENTFEFEGQKPGGPKTKIVIYRYSGKIQVIEDSKWVQHGTCQEINPSSKKKF